MTTKADYRIIPELGLILECCKGKASIDDAIRMKKAEIADEQYNPDYNILVDFHEFESLLDESVPESTFEFFRFLISLDLRGRIAIFTAEPVQVVAGVMLKDLYNNPQKLKIEVFSTMNAAIKYLDIPAASTELVRTSLQLLNAGIA